jgi:hypothetical protein
LKVIGDDQRAGPYTAFDQPVGADLGAELNCGHVSLTVGTGDINLVQALELLHGDLRDKEGAMANFGICLDAAELTGTEDVARVGKLGGDADRTGFRVHLAIDEGDVPL